MGLERRWSSVGSGRQNRCPQGDEGGDYVTTDVPAAVRIYRLDAAVMLALLFSSEPSRAELAPAAIDRLREVHARLYRVLAADTCWEG